MAETIKAEVLLLHASADGAIAQRWFAHQGVAPAEGVRRDEREGLLQPKSAEQLLQPKSAEQSEQKKQAGEVTYGVAKANHELLCEWKIFNLQRGCQS